ncbi:MAG: SRPBCC family protein [Dermatophilaceae bacterium]
MNRFTASTTAEATISASLDDVWAVVTDAALLARFTPFLARITDHGEHWVWEMVGVPALGRTLAFTFTERMTFDPPHRIEFAHEPPAGTTEHAGVAGWYALEPRDGGTHLSTTLHITAHLPAPGLMRIPVEAAMHQVASFMGTRFSQNLLRHLDAVELPP